MKQDFQKLHNVVQKYVGNHEMVLIKDDSWVFCYLNDPFWGF